LSKVRNYILALLLILALAVAGCASTDENHATPLPSPSPTTASNTTEPFSLPSITEVVEAVEPAVVSIVVGTVSYNIFFQPVPSEQAGSGVIIDESGYILTNNHVVEGAESIEVTLPDGRNFDASLVGTDPLTDLAVIKIDGDDLPTVTFGDSSGIMVGQWVVAIGNALALEGGPTVTVGVISALGRTINPGNSGGPLINLQGEVVGINTAKITAVEVSGVGFAVSANTAGPVAAEIIAKGYVSRPYLGVSLVTVTPAIASSYNLATNEGGMVYQVVPGTPAEQAGLRAYDVITRIDGEEVTAADDVILAIRDHDIGDTIEITYFRGTMETTTSAKLVERPRS